MSMKFQLRKAEAEEQLQMLRSLQVDLDVFKDDLFTEGEVDVDFINMAIDTLVRMRKYIFIVNGEE